MPTPTVTTTFTSSVCPKCGTMTNSGKLTCCSRGGSWFGNCGSAGQANAGHTWYEGIQACTARQLETAVDQELHFPQTKRSGSSDNTNTNRKSKAIIVAAHSPAFTPATTSTLISASKTSTSMLDRATIGFDTVATSMANTVRIIHSSAGMITFENTLHVIARMSMILIVVAWN